VNQVFQFSSQQEVAAVFGTNDRTLRRLRDEFRVQVVARGDAVMLDGEPQSVKLAAQVLERLQHRAQTGEPLDDASVDGIITSMLRFGAADEGSRIRVFYKGRLVVPKSPGQERYIEAIRRNDIVLSIGPAGTGKTYLAVAMAISDLRAGLVRRIVLARPAVEAGERLGFLPGDMQEKVNPYLRPLYDALNDMMDFAQVQRFMDSDIIEVAPLAFMRGRTLNQSFIILDEAQNTTPAQMLMFLTRMGLGSKAVITGDVTQIDLPPGEKSGLVESVNILAGIAGIEFVYLNRSDIVRHRLVQDVVDAYEAYRKRQRRELGG
jgi:phosphate starvation-inducible PhoH-like protein